MREVARLREERIDAVARPLSVVSNEPQEVAVRDGTSIDTEGVGELIAIAVERGRKTRPNLKLGLCGEHGGDPASIHVCEEAGLDYVSCSPFRVPIARLAAAQAALKERS